MTFEEFNGEVTYSSPSPNGWSLGPDSFMASSDPTVGWTECAQDPVPADTAGFAQAVAADPSFETTAPVDTRIGGHEAVSIDVALAHGDRLCLAAGFGSDVYYSFRQESGLRLRLYLVDVPGGMSMQTLLISVIASEENFEDVIDNAAPILDSIEFHAP